MKTDLKTEPISRPAAASQPSEADRASTKATWQQAELANLDRRAGQAVNHTFYLDIPAWADPHDCVVRHYGGVDYDDCERQAIEETQEEANHHRQPVKLTTLTGEYEMILQPE